MFWLLNSYIKGQVHIRVYTFFTFIEYTMQDQWAFIQQNKKFWPHLNSE